MSLSRKLLDSLNERSQQDLEHGATLFYNYCDKVRNGENDVSVAKTLTPLQIALMMEYAAGEIEKLHHRDGIDWGKLIPSRAPDFKYQ